MKLPSDPMMLYSVINMKLRDQYESLAELCEDAGIDEAALTAKMKAAGFEYNRAANQFR